MVMLCMLPLLLVLFHHACLGFGDQVGDSSVLFWQAKAKNNKQCIECQICLSLSLLTHHEMKDGMTLLTQLHSSNLIPNYDYVAYEALANVYGVLTRRLTYAGTKLMHQINMINLNLKQMQMQIQHGRTKEQKLKEIKQQILQMKNQHQSIKTQQKAALEQTVFFYDKAHKARKIYNNDHDLNSDSSEKLITIKQNYISNQMIFEQPYSVTLRRYGDALQWIGKPNKAKTIFRLGVNKHHFWTNYLCRPIIYNSQNNVDNDKIILNKNPINPDWKHEYFVDTNNIPQDFANIIEDNMVSIKREIMSQMENNNNLVWKDVESGLFTKGYWQQLFIMINGEFVENICDSLFPILCNVLSNITDIRIKDGQIKLSKMIGGTYVRAHAGPTNDRLRMHCAIDVEAGVGSIDSNVKDAETMNSYIRVGNAKRKWVDTQCFVFDESCEHEVVIADEYNSKQSSNTRTVLIIDFANPFVSDVKQYQNVFVSRYSAKAKQNFEMFWKDRGESKHEL